MQTQHRFAAHELLEAQEAIRTKASNIELYGVLFSMAGDVHLKDILYDQQQRMIAGYEQTVAVLQGRAPFAPPRAAQLRIYERPQPGWRPSASAAPDPNATRLSDGTIASIALNLHKSGAVMAMLHANESVDPALRSAHVTSANVCQDMSWELFQYMNDKGQYQAPQLADPLSQALIQGAPHAQSQQAYQTHFSH